MRESLVMGKWAMGFRSMIRCFFLEDDFKIGGFCGCPGSWKFGLKVRRSVEKKTPSPMDSNGWGLTDAGGKGHLVAPKNSQVLSEKLDVAFRQLRVSAEGGVGFVGKGFFLFCFFWGAEV